MNQDEIIEMARQAGAAVGKPTPDGPKIVFTQYLNIYAFAKLVEAHIRGQIFKPDWDNYRQGLIDGAVSEREACAVIAEEWFCGCGRGSCPEGDRRAHDIADSIRARGEA